MGRPKSNRGADSNYLNKRKGADRRIPICVYVPENFDPKTSLPSELHRYEDCARYFLHRIIWGKIQRKLTLEGFTLIKFDYLRAVIPDRQIKPLKQALIKSGVIECDKQYIEGQKSLGYRMLPPYSEARIVRTALTDEETAERLRANRRAEYKKVRLDVHCYLRTRLRRLEVDLPRALSLINNHPQFELVRIPVEQIACKDFAFSVCRYGRVHTDLTRSSKQIRPALHVGGKPLVGIDIANSQPLFLALVLINFRKNGNKAFSYVTFSKTKTNPYETIDEIIQRTIASFEQFEKEEKRITLTHISASITTRRGEENVQNTLKHKPFQTTATCPDNGMVNRDFLKEDELSFLSLCERGELYESFMHRLEISSRNQAKV
jgi:hypothetical protein